MERGTSVNGARNERYLRAESAGSERGTSERDKSNLFYHSNSNFLIQIY